MKKNLFRLIFVCVLSFLLKPALAWEGMPLPPLKVEGRYLTDTHGNVVNLHGFAQTYSP